ncbi:MAG: OmpA family protein [Sulfurovum sp.]
MTKIDNNSDIEKLRALLLSEERTQLKKLNNRVTNIYDSDEFREILANSISKGVTENKDSMIDALYPIIGGMISKYVTQAIKEMMQNINNRIEDGLSFDKYRRKIKSKITGVSEMELLFEESDRAIISSLFIIQKESGLLIAQSELDDKHIDDPHMVASMASAIRDFINDWVESNKSQSEIQILSYGNSTLYIESAGSVYIIAFLNAEPEYELRKNINVFFASIVRDYSSFFQAFDGDDESVEVGELSSKMYNYLAKQKKEVNQVEDKKSIKYPLYILIFLLSFYLTYTLDILYREYSIQNAIREETNQEVVVTQIDNSIVLEGYVDKINMVYKIEDIAHSKTDKPIVNNLIVPIKNILEIITSSDNKISILNKKNKLSKRRLNNKLKYLNKQLRKSQHQIYQLQRNSVKYLEIFKKVDIKESISDKLNKLFEKNLFYKKSDNSLDFRSLHIFNIGKSKYDKDKIKIIGENFEKYISILSDYREYIDVIIIEGHTDSEGDEEKNIRLSEERASSVIQYLYNLPFVEDSFMNPLMEIDGLGSEYPILKHGVEDKNASRRIKIKFKLKDKI